MNRRPFLLIAAAGAVALIAGSCSSSSTADDPPSTTEASGTTSPAGPTDDPLVIDTTAGPVRGAEADGIRSFLGIPFAEPPLADLRWAPPEPAVAWSDEFVATTPAASCPQLPGLTSQFIPAPEPDEDCLTLDVFGALDAQDRPVMVWIHGGGFTSGSGHSPLYDGTRFAQEGVVLVSINYRLDALGFLPTSSLAGGEGPSANWGILDQIAALEWVQDNIAAFGGDRDNITIFGESAGGFSVCALLASPMSADLFDRAIIESGGGCGPLTQPDDSVDGRPSGDEIAGTWLDATPCNDAEDPLPCLRDLPVDEVLAASESTQEDVNFGLVADGVSLIDSAYEQAEAGALRDVPIITGSNLDENALFSLGAEEPTAEELSASIGRVVDSDMLDDVIASYAGYDSNLEKLRAFRTEMVFTCPAQRFADVARDDTDVYTYEFQRRSPRDPFGVGATHGAEMIYLFGNPDGIVGLGAILDGEDLELASAMRSTWVSFAADGVPTADPDWPRYDPATATIYVWDIPASVTSEIRGGRCDLLASAGAFS